MQGGGLIILTERSGLDRTTMGEVGPHDNKSCGINEQRLQGPAKPAYNCYGECNLFSDGNIIHNKR